MSSTFDKLRKRAKDNSLPTQPEVHGKWFNIRVMPDLATGELLNIGVAFSSADHRLVFKMLDRFEAFSCLYHNRVTTETLRFLVQTVESSLPEQLSPGDLPLIPSPHIRFSDPKFISGHDPVEILDDLYQETVTLAHAGQEKTGEPEKSASLNTASVRKQVFAAIARLDPLSNIVAEDPQWPLPIKEDGKLRVLDMPLRSVHRFGTVLSAFYQSEHIFKFHLWKAGLDLATAFRLYPGDHGGLFILQPSRSEPGYTKKDRERIRNNIAELACRMPQDEFRLTTSDSDDTLAEQILDWAKAA